MLETEDFLHFKFSTLNGPEVQNKGMALFPRKINGQYAMLSRQDDENIFLMYSDMPHFWYTQGADRQADVSLGVRADRQLRLADRDRGRLAGADPRRRARCASTAIGAFLLDLDDPTRVIGRLREPLLAPNDNEREGYVPNVVYSCGAVVHGGELVIPYAMSDYASTFATVPLDEVLDAMVRERLTRSGPGRPLGGSSRRAGRADENSATAVKASAAP